MTEENTQEQVIEFSQEDLSSIGRIADEGKDDDQIWKEIQAEKNGAAAASEDDAGAEADKEDKGTPAASEAAGDEEVDAPPAQGAADAQPPADKAAGKSDSSEGDDIWADATPEQLKAHKELERQAKGQNGRISALQRQLDQLKQSRAQPPANGRTRSEGNVSVNKVLEPLDALAEDFPEFQKSMRAAIEPLARELVDLRQSEERRRQDAESQHASDVANQEARLSELSPGWSEFIDENIETFMDWADDQPAKVRATVRQNFEEITDAEKTHEILQDFKKFMGVDAGDAGEGADPEPTSEQDEKLKTKRALQKRSTNGPRTTSGAPVTTATPDDDEAIWAQIQKDKARKRAEQAALHR